MSDLPSGLVRWSKQRTGSDNGVPRFSVLAHRDGVERPVRVGFGLLEAAADGLIERLEQRQTEYLAGRAERPETPQSEAVS